MVQAEITVDDLAASPTERLALNEYEGNRVEITGLHLLRGGHITMPESLANMNFSDDSSSSANSYANDSLELIRHNIRGRMNRRLSNDSYANDSVEIIKNKKLHNIVSIKKLQIKLQTSQNIKLSAQQMSAKNIAIPSSISPDLAGLKQMKISNHAA
jgi:hypothetical protein